MNDEITSRALAILEACSSDDENDVAAPRNKDPENEDHVSSARPIFNASPPSTPLFFQRDADLMDDQPSSAGGEISAGSNIPQDGMISTNPDNNAFESASLDPISAASISIGQISNANGTPLANQSCNEAFWTCPHCSYNVNSVSKHNCVYCSANRAGDEQIRIAPSKSNSHGLNTNIDNYSEEYDEHDSDSDSAYEEGAVHPWSCENCCHLNTQTKYKCGGCKSWRSRKRFVRKNKAGKRSKKFKVSVKHDEEDSDELEQKSDDESPSALTPFLCYDGKNEDTLVTRAKPNDQITSGESWACIRCGSDNDSIRKRCSECKGWRDGKIGTSSNKTHALSKGAEGEEDFKEWTCIKCSQINTKSKSKCLNCGCWKDGKRPVKIKYSPPNDEANSKQSPKNAALVKKELKPRFEVNEQVYAPWFGHCRSEQAWYPAVITNYTVKKYGEYGEIRSYDVRFNDDRTAICDVEDYCVFSREDYLLQVADPGRTEWIGVKNVLDKSSRDFWAKQVGWYEATIDGDKYSFARLFDALRAYDDFVLAKKGKNAKPSELNLPNDIGRETRSRYTSTKSHLHDAKNNNTNNSTTHNYKGVSFSKARGKYEAYIHVKKKRPLGIYLLAADAALAQDKCVRLLGLSSQINFPSLTDYNSARKKESKERNIHVPSSEVQSYLNSKVDNVAYEMNDADSGEIFEVQDATEGGANVGEANLSPNPRMQPGASQIASPRSAKSYAAKYKGVYFDKSTSKYIARYQHAGKAYHFGRCDLAADAAMLYDKCLAVLEGSDCAPVNFTSESEYIDSRRQESSERRIEYVCHLEALGIIKEQVKKLSSKVANNAVGRPADNIPSVQPTRAKQKEEPHSVASKSNSIPERQVSNSNTVRPNNVPKLIMLTSDQTESLRFPTGCPVWLPNGNRAGTYNEGKVTAVHFDLQSRDLLYEVAAKQQAASILVPENNLAFAPQCPVFISDDNHDNPSADRSKSSLTGRVLLCKQVDATWIYTVAIQNEAGLEMRENMPFSQLTYWKEDSA